MDFYDDIDVDFGDIGELINMMDKTTKPANNQMKKEIVFEDEVDDEECENYDLHKADFTNPINPDFIDSISREVSEVTRNEFLNEQIEKQYKILNKIPEPIKVKKKKKSTVPKVPKTNNITKKSDLRKEMAMGSGEPDYEKVGFSKTKKNALVTSLVPKKPEPDDRPDSPEDIENGPQDVVDQVFVAEAVEVEKDEMDNSANKIAMQRVREWLVGIRDSMSDDEFYSMNESSNTTAGSTDYFTASTYDETPRKTYRATSKRYSLTKVSPPIADDKVGFKKNTAKTDTSTPAKSPTSSMMQKKETYIPGSYNREFQLKSKDFPAIR